MPKPIQPQYQPSNMQYETFNAFLWQNGNKSIIQYFEQVGISLRLCLKMKYLMMMKLNVVYISTFKFETEIKISM